MRTQDKDELRQHKRELPCGCQRHRVCLSRENVVTHAQERKHGSCFFDDCDSEFRTVRGWTKEEVKQHVEEAHGLQPGVVEEVE